MSSHNHLDDLSAQRFDMEVATASSHASLHARSPHEELVNAVTHGLGFLLSIVGSILLLHAVVVGGNTTKVVGCAVYATSLMSVFAASTFSHGIRCPRLKRAWRIWDQGLIYLLIAGSYTAFTLPLLDQTAYQYLLAIVWGLALIGFCSKVLVRHSANRFSTLSYVALAWLPLTAVNSALPLLPVGAVQWLFAGGIVYTLGVVFLVNDRKATYLHSVWHLFVIVGGASHFIGIYYYIVPATA